MIHLSFNRNDKRDMTAEKKRQTRETIREQSEEAVKLDFRSVIFFP